MDPMQTQNTECMPVESVKYSRNVCCHCHWQMEFCRHHRRRRWPHIAVRSKCYCILHWTVSVRPNTPPDPNEIANREAVASILDAYTSFFRLIWMIFFEIHKNFGNFFCRKKTWRINSKLCKLAVAQQSTENIPSEWLKCDVMWCEPFGYVTRCVWVSAWPQANVCVLQLHKSVLFWWLTAFVFFFASCRCYAVLCHTENCPSHSACSHCVCGCRIYTALSFVCLFGSVHADLNDINCVVHRTTLPLISFLWKRLSMSFIPST